MGKGNGYPACCCIQEREVMNEYRRIEPAKAIQWDGTEEMLVQIKEHFSKCANIRRILDMNVLCIPYDAGERENKAMPGTWVIIEDAHQPYFMEDEAFHKKFRMRG